MVRLQFDRLIIWAGEVDGKAEKINSSSFSQPQVQGVPLTHVQDLKAIYRHIQTVQKTTLLLLMITRKKLTSVRDAKDHLIPFASELLSPSSCLQ